MGLLGDVLGAGASLATGNIAGAAGSLAKVIGDLQGSGDSSQQVGQQLAQLDQALKLPPGTLENILKANSGGGQGSGAAQGAGAGAFAGGAAGAAQGAGASAAQGAGEQASNQTRGVGDEASRPHRAGREHHHEMEGSHHRPAGQPGSPGQAQSANTPPWVTQARDQQMQQAIEQVLKKHHAERT